MEKGISFNKSNREPPSNCYKAQKGAPGKERPFALADCDNRPVMKPEFTRQVLSAKLV